MLAEEKLEALPLQIRKVMQFHEACQQRMGVVVVGPSGCGKSTIWRLLLKANAKLGRKIPTYVMNPKPLHPPSPLPPPLPLPLPLPLTRYVMNPKAMPREQLLGHMDMDTREWFDGVLTASARKVVREPAEVESWII